MQPVCVSLSPSPCLQGNSGPRPPQWSLVHDDIVGATAMLNLFPRLPIDKGEVYVEPLTNAVITQEAKLPVYKYVSLSGLL